MSLLVMSSLLYIRKGLWDMKEKKIGYTYALPLMIVLAVVPLITTIAIYQTDIGQNPWIA